MIHVTFVIYFHNIFLNSARLSIILMLSGMSFQIVAAVYCKEYKPYVVVSTIGTSSLKYPLNIYGVTFNLKISYIYGGFKLFRMLKTSVTN